MTHYDALGVSNNASDDEIKKSYRTLSLRHHPDRGGSKEKFQEISAAYDVLSDPEKRRQYDFELRLGSGGGGGVDPFAEIFRHAGGRGGGGGPADIFSALFGMGLGGMPGMQDMGMGGPGIHVFHGGMGPDILFQRMNGMDLGGGNGFGVMKPPPINISISMTLQQAYTGISYPVEIDRWVMQGDQKRFEKELVYVQIPAGIDEHEMIELNDKGHIVNSAVRGDVRISVEIDNKTEFQRRGLDLHFNKVISLKEALCGFTFELLHLNGKKLCMNNTMNTMIIKPNSQKVVPDMGMVRGDARGKLIIEFEVEFPGSLTEEQTTAIRTVL
jgi:DnaJ-class molecular chaperone